MYTQSIFRHAAKLAGSVLLVWLVVFVIQPQTALARPSGCRVDPIIVLADGTKITVTLDIGTTPDQIKKVTYRLRAPNRTQIESVEYVVLDLSADQVGGLNAGTQTDGVAIDERVRLAGVTVDGAYRVDIQVNTGDKQAPIEGFMVIEGGTSSNAVGTAKDILTLTASR